MKRSIFVTLGFLGVASASLRDTHYNQIQTEQQQQQFRRQLVTDNMCVRSLDDQGLNGLDQGTDGNDDSQADLSAICVGDNNGFISWAWDTVGLSGSNSQDACTYWRQPDDTVISLY